MKINHIRGGVTMATAILALSVQPLTAQPIEFTESAAAIGIQYHHEAEPGVPIGAGFAWEDFDNDGDYDLYGVQGTGCNRLFLNNGSGAFVETVDAAGAGDCDGASHGVSSADYDNDGDADIYVANNGQNRLLRNRLIEDGELTFVDVTTITGIDGDGADNSASSTWADYDNDGFVDLFVVQHMRSMEPLVCAPNLVYHNNGDGTFTEVGEELDIADGGLADLADCGLAVTTSDFDNDGDQDLMVVPDFGDEATPNRLFRNEGNDPVTGEFLGFVDISAQSGFDYVMFGMGIAIGDIDLDGDFDYYMSDIGPNNLARNNGDGTFTDIAESAGVEASDPEIYGERGLVSWGAVFADFDNSGVEDLAVANGGAPEDKWPGMFGAGYTDTNPNYCYRNNTDDTFSELHDDLKIENVSYNRNATIVDVDDDGDLDLHFGNLQGFNHFYLNNLGESNWFKVHAEGTIGNRDAIGALIRVRSGARIQMREIDGGSSFMSLNMRTAHFGLGDVEELDQVITTFQSGLVSEQRHVLVNQTINVVEPIYTVMPSSTDLTLAPGDTLSVEFTTTNQIDEVVVYDAWMDIRNITGVEKTVLQPTEHTLLPGDSFVTPVSVSVPLAIDPGVRELSFKVGHYPDEIVHQTFVDVEIQ